MILNSLCAGSFFFLGFILWVKSLQENRIANRWLAVSLLGIGIMQMDDALIFSKAYRQFPHYFLLTDLVLFIVPPSLFLAVRHFVNPDKRFYWKEALHFIPLALVFLILIPELSASPEALAESIEADLKNRMPGEWAFLIFLPILIQFGVYLTLSYRKLRRHLKNLEMITATPQASSLKWLQWSLLVLAGMLVVWTFEVRYYFYEFNAWTTMVYLSGAYVLGYYALRQGEVFPYAPPDLEAISAIFNPAPGSGKQIPEANAQLKAGLLELIEEKKIFLDPELSLPKLARQLGCSTHELSFLINHSFGKNFYQFINRYRVQESQRLLLDPQFSHLNILAIGFESGFNSKTTFNTAFKNQTGMSPAEFRGKEK